MRKDGTRFWGDVVITALTTTAATSPATRRSPATSPSSTPSRTHCGPARSGCGCWSGRSSDYAIIALDPQGIIETWNLGAERVKGYTADEAIGRSFAMFYTEEDRRTRPPLELLTGRARPAASSTPAGGCARTAPASGATWSSPRCTTTTATSTGYAKVTRDRTDLKALEDAQDAFYATFNHDFRTPVTAIKGFVDAIRDADDEARADLIDRVESSADRLLGMVEGLVEFATQRAGQATLLLADIDLAQVARSAVHDLSPPARPRPGARRRRRRPRHRQRGRDAPRDHQPRGQRAEVLPARHARWRSLQPWRRRGSQISVPTTAAGSTPTTSSTIFDEFVRGRMAEDDGGTGLGLASVRELVAQQNGTVAIESEVGVGTTVTVELPSHACLKPSAPSQRLGVGRGRPTSSVGVRSATRRRPATAPGSPRPRPPSACAASCARGCSSRSPNTVPTVWSVSCCRQRASRPPPS